MKHTIFLSVVRFIALWYLKQYNKSVQVRAQEPVVMGLRLDAMTEGHKLHEVISLIENAKLEEEIVNTTCLTLAETNALQGVYDEGTIKAAGLYSNHFLSHQYIKQLHNEQAEVTTLGWNLLKKAIDFHRMVEKAYEGVYYGKD